MSPNKPKTRLIKISASPKLTTLNFELPPYQSQPGQPGPWRIPRVAPNLESFCGRVAETGCSLDAHTVGLGAGKNPWLVLFFSVFCKHLIQWVCLHIPTVTTFKYVGAGPGLQGLEVV